MKLNIETQIERLKKLKEDRKKILGRFSYLSVNIFYIYIENEKAIQQLFNGNFTQMWQSF